MFVCSDIIVENKLFADWKKELVQKNKINKKALYNTRRLFLSHIDILWS